jgi:hypothetical protein
MKGRHLVQKGCFCLSKSREPLKFATISPKPSENFLVSQSFSPLTIRAHRGCGRLHEPRHKLVAVRDPPDVTRVLCEGFHPALALIHIEPVLPDGPPGSGEELTAATVSMAQSRTKYIDGNGLGVQMVFTSTGERSRLTLVKRIGNHVRMVISWPVHMRRPLFERSGCNTVRCNQTRRRSHFLQLALERR